MGDADAALPPLSMPTHTPVHVWRRHQVQRGIYGPRQARTCWRRGHYRAGGAHRGRSHFPGHACGRPAACLPDWPR
eukprot:358478-Chlamydomonas_euryale.AAC.1